jgi:hypothetical protein
MATEQHSEAAIVRRLWDIWSGGDLVAIDDLVDDGFTNFGIRRSGGRAGMRIIVWRIRGRPGVRMEDVRFGPLGFAACAPLVRGAGPTLGSIRSDCGGREGRWHRPTRHLRRP